MEIPHGRLFVAEYFDHLLAVQHFLDKTVHCAQIHLLADIIFRRQLREIGRHQEHDYRRQDRDHGQRRIQDDHGDERRRHGNEGVDDLGDALAQKLPERIHIIGVHGHNIAVGMGVKIFDGQGFHPGEQIVS